MDIGFQASSIVIFVIFGQNFSSLYCRLTLLPGVMNFFQRVRIPFISEPITQTLRPFSVGHRYMEMKIKKGESLDETVDYSSETNLYRLEFIMDKEFALQNSYLLQCLGVHKRKVYEELDLTVIQ